MDYTDGGETFSAETNPTAGLFGEIGLMIITENKIIRIPHLITNDRDPISDRGDVSA
jgi:hypothetical protein